MRLKMENKKGLSAVVATLIIILLVLVAVGILWVVIRNVIQGGADTIELSQKCLEVKLEASGVSPVGETSGIYSVTLARKAGGSDPIRVKLNFFNATGNVNSGIIDFGTTLNVLDTKTNSSITTKTDGSTATNITVANKMEYTIYFVNDLGEEQICESTESVTVA
ncbi:MAG: hypothetical protein KJ905_03405 [Nanoarchaeota archaeon]|nr:hypothetical protein [Nanoarchaeota archaeon]